ncbi:Tll0287-like domain-containing protein [Lyngbya confervoides]|uniref:DUF3365 domain-containing protein n=1 Tax=Lyngbya confervoides BDU141951 TaxID=1574623 RepID=A0ABD4T2H5_9CYAN|nr:DUF3365 domain-containing protein [Lyngbya confervoides]MCM1982601.1 DUF3365 domain-containing protein [Lyngbya confervoides BDU141951]
MSRLERWMQTLKTRTVAFVAILLSVSVTVVACSGSGGGPAATGGIAPDLVADYIHTVMAADRTAYTKHVVNRSKTLEGKAKADGVLNIEATEGWQQTDGIPLPAQMFRLGSEIANESGFFTYNLISPWYINDNHAPKSDFEKTAMDAVIANGEPYKEYQEVGGQKYFSALYPDKAVAEACVTCHNTHPVHKERYPDKVFTMDEVMGGIIINIPLDQA